MKNIGALMRQAQQMQQKMNDLQEKMAAVEITGEAGAGLVAVTISGQGAMKKVKIAPEMIDPAEIEMLEDLIVAAYNNAKSKSEAAMQAEVQKLTGGMSLPPGFKLPF